MILTTTLRCGLSGLDIGQLEVITTAGALPYLSHWDKMQVRHPVFSLSPIKLFQFTKKEWDRLAKRAVDEELTTNESNILAVAYLACLHQLESIKQDQPTLPPLHIVQSTLNKVLALAYWKYTLDSKRFRFPTYHICQLNNNIDFKNIHDYLDLCFDVKDRYGEKMDELEEAAKIKAARDAMDALTREWISPISRKVLWKWVKHNLPVSYAADAEGWLSTLFLGGGTAIVEFNEEDLDLFEEIITCSCPAGTGIMKPVRERITQVWEIWKNHHRAFEIDLEDFAINNGLLVNGAQVLHPDPGEEPQAKQFNGNKASYYIAHAKWTIAKAAWDAQNKKSSDPDINTELGEL